MMHLRNFFDVPFTGVFGGLDLHGKDVGTSWTLLAQTANPGDSQITLATAVTWKVGEEIVIAPTDFSVWEKETFAITAVSNGGTTLTLNSTVQFKHIGMFFNSIHIQSRSEIIVDVNVCKDKIANLLYPYSMCLQSSI